MFSHNFISYSGKIIAKIIGRIIYFPLWWYTSGFLETLKNLFNFWRGQEKSLGFSIWLKNIFTPMYGQNDITGRLISFVIRLFQVVVRGLVLIFWLFIVIILTIFWLLLPILLFLALVFQIS